MHPRVRPHAGQEVLNKSFETHNDLPRSKKSAGSTSKATGTRILRKILARSAFGPDKNELNDTGVV